ncbi:MAG TPA: glycosyltransferase family 39 protein, partial [Candidatus Saccharimonadales bacterium]|nr:glycosyltransferase family 39 protein [Candidatus Saccharimonadales bacterium]
MTGRTPRAARWAVAIGAVALLFTLLGRLPLLDPDEGRYARTSQLMIERGDLVVPWFEGRPRLEKPAFFYWMEAAAFSALGFTETAARLPSAAAAAGTLLWLYLFARRRAGEATALAACAICATTPLFLALGRTATTDMTLTFFVFGAS